MAAFSIIWERIILREKLIVIDCQNDFISGSLACYNAISAVKKIVKYINQNDPLVYYSLDWHSEENKSFIHNGGIWPPHCIKDTFGAKLYKDFYSDIIRKESIPNENNMYYKGLDDEIEEYSAFDAKSKLGSSLKDSIEDSVVICGIASEFCVRETVLEFIKAEKMVYILSSGLGYVDINEHKKNLKQLEELGAVIL